jgi:hypothetical protein
MLSTRWQRWFRRPRLAARRRALSRVGAHQPHNEVRPRLEALEDRVTPVPIVPSSTSITGIAQQYTFFNQMETISVQVTSPGLTVNQGQVNITDGGQSHTVNVSNGTASSTFVFSLFTPLPQAHSVTASFTDTTPNVLFNFSSSSTQATAPDTTFKFLFQIAFDFVLIQSLTASTSSGG